RKALAQALESFEARAGRRRALVYLGDGRSVADPLDAEGRSELCRRRARKQVGFFPVPPGDPLGAQNLHGLVQGTGGKCVRQGTREDLPGLVARLQKVVAEPVLYPEGFELPASVKE